MPTKKYTADQVRAHIASGKLTTKPAKAKSIGQNLKFSQDRIIAVPANVGTGLIKETK